MKNILLVLAISVIIVACTGSPAKSVWLVQPTDVFGAQQDLPVLATDAIIIATLSVTEVVAFAQITNTPDVIVYTNTVLRCKVSVNVKNGMLHIRDCPDVSCTSVGYLTEGEEVVYIDTIYGWRKLSDNKYIYAEYCKEK